GKGLVGPEVRDREPEHLRVYSERPDEQRERRGDIVAPILPPKAFAQNGAMRPVPSDSGRPNHLVRVLTVGGCIDNQQFQALASHTNRVEDALRKEEHVAGTHFMLYA